MMIPPDFRWLENHHSRVSDSQPRCGINPAWDFSDLFREKSHQISFVEADCPILKGIFPLKSHHFFQLAIHQEPAGFWTAAPNNVWRDNAWGTQGPVLQNGKASVNSKSCELILRCFHQWVFLRCTYPWYPVIANHGDHHHHHHHHQRTSTTKQEKNPKENLMKPSKTQKETRNPTQMTYIKIYIYIYNLYTNIDIYIYTYIYLIYIHIYI